jgi:murein DD-endopeptidase MepM/ murein hydrolase activator NlpD
MSQDRIAIYLISIMVLAGCTQPALITATSTPPEVIRATDTPVPSTATPEITLKTPGIVQICSPLSDFTLTELGAIVSNPFAPSTLEDARDGGHHGVDFAYYTHPVTGKVMLGAPIQAVLPGRVASVLTNRPPYGNMILIETRLEDLPEDVQALFAEYPRPTPSAAETHLSCLGMGELPLGWEATRPSLYTLYAHMQSPADFKSGDKVECGQVIGQVGTSGSSVNPHLHLEMRYGPGGASFTSLAHYSGDATPDEIAAYCTWRVSGVFQLIDPLRVLGLSD